MTIETIPSALKTGFKFSVPIGPKLGASNFGSSQWSKPQTSTPTGNLNTLSEKFMKKYNIPGNEIIIASKCYMLVPKKRVHSKYSLPKPRKTRDYVNNCGWSCFDAVEASLERLQINRYDTETPAEETKKALHGLVRCGKVHCIGASSIRFRQFAHLNEIAVHSGRERFECEMYAYRKTNGIEIIP
ncbi:hypothetical protein DFS33DRAFT_1277557 [Desarmillaria ectypa]|nr:hypothetical protein DFS33DRAFT_1277557 [Desarmillaria ectypa]